MLLEQLRKWLRETGTSRQDLAEKLFVSPVTVDGWLLQRNPRPIPLKKQAAIRALIAPGSDSGHVAVDFCFTDEEWAEITRDIPDGVNKEEAVKAKLLAFIRAARIGQ